MAVTASNVPTLAALAAAASTTVSARKGYRKNLHATQQTSVQRMARAVYAEHSCFVRTCHLPPAAPAEPAAMAPDRPNGAGPPPGSAASVSRPEAVRDGTVVFARLLVHLVVRVLVCLLVHLVVVGDVRVVCDAGQIVVALCSTSVAVAWALRFRLRVCDCSTVSLSHTSSSATASSSSSVVVRRPLPLLRPLRRRITPPSTAAPARPGSR